VTFEEDLLGLVERGEVESLPLAESRMTNIQALVSTPLRKNENSPKSTSASTPRRCVWEMATFSTGVTVVRRFTVAM